MAKRIIGFYAIILSVVLSGCNDGKNLVTTMEAESKIPTDLTQESESTTSMVQSEETKTIYKVGKAGDDYILPHAQTHIYTSQELAELTLEELGLARNEIYARRGRRFDREDLKNYFEGKSWYQGTVEAKAFDEGIFNQNEKDNIKLLRQTESKNETCKIPKIGVEEFPVIDGSTATLPISGAIYRMATGATVEEAEKAIHHKKTTEAWMRLMAEDDDSESVDLVIAYEPGETVMKALKSAGEEVLMKPIGRDALVFLKNQSNEVKSLTTKQMVDIYSGKLNNWKEIGGKDRTIQAFQRPKDSGSQNLMEKLVMKGVPMSDAPGEQVVNGMGELMDQVSAYDNSGDALGYSVYYYAQNMYHKPELAFMAVDGVLPSSESIRSGSYPFINDFYAAIRADEPKDSKTYQLYEWLTSEDGQSLINGLGYVGVKDETKPLPKELTEEEETAKGTIQLPSGHVILAAGEHLFGECGIGVFDSNMRLLEFISHVESPQLTTFLECSKEDSILMRDTRTGEYRRYLIGEKKYVSAKETEEEERVYELANSFADNHPQLLEKHNATKEQVDVLYYSEMLPPVILIMEGRIENYYDVYGDFLLNIDTQQENHWEKRSWSIYPMGAGMAYRVRREEDTQKQRYQIYKGGALIKELDSEDNWEIWSIEPSFYTKMKGNYLYIYNYQDEVCGKFLYGYYGDD